jgi:hypothetical protein
MHQFSESYIAKTRGAGDHFIVGRKPNVSYGRSRVMEHILPRDLSFFRLVILANIIHTNHPLYSLFTQQCYWFAKIIYLIVDEPKTADSELDNVSGDEFNLRIPPDLYLPREAGRWRGILVTRVSEKIVELMREKVEIGYKDALLRVCLFPLNFFQQKLIFDID